MEQRVCVKFCCKTDKTFTETWALLQQAYKEDCMSRSQCHEWFKRFKSGRTSIEEESRSGRPSTSTNDENIDAVRSVIRANRRLTVREVAEEVGISIGSCHEILTVKLGMHRVSAKLVPRLLTDDQKENRVKISQELLDRASTDKNYIKTIITGDETWVYGYDIETKAQSSQWIGKMSPRPKKARMSRSNLKLMLIIFFDYRGVVHHEFVPQGQTVNKEFYVQVLRRLREDVRRKRPELWKNKSWVLHHNNAPSHSSLLVSQFLAGNEIAVLPHPPYSPDLAPADFFLFPKLKTTLKGRRFQSVDEIQQNSQRQLRTISQNEFQGAFQQWQKRWERCVASRGEYFEGDKHL